MRFEKHVDVAFAFLEANAGVAPEKWDERTYFFARSGGVRGRILVAYDRRFLEDPEERRGFAARLETLLEREGDDYIHLLLPLGTALGSAKDGPVYTVWANRTKAQKERSSYHSLPLFIDSIFRVVERPDQQTSRSTLGVSPDWYDELPKIPARFHESPLGGRFPTVAELAEKRDEARVYREAVAEAFPILGSDEERSDYRPIGSRLWFVLGPAGVGKSTLFDQLFADLSKRYLKLKQSGSSLGCRPLEIKDAGALRDSVRESGDLAKALLRSSVAADGGLSEAGLVWLIREGFVTLMIDAVDEIYLQDQSFFDRMIDWLGGDGSRANIFLFGRDSIFTKPLSGETLLGREVGKDLERRAHVATLALWDDREVKKMATAVFRECPEMVATFSKVAKGAASVQDWLRNLLSLKGDPGKRPPLDPERLAESAIDMLRSDGVAEHVIRLPWLCIRLMEYFATTFVARLIFYDKHAIIPALDGLVHDCIERERARVDFDYRDLIVADEVAKLTEIQANLSAGGAAFSRFQERDIQGLVVALHAIARRWWFVKGQAVLPHPDELCLEAAELYNIRSWFEELAFCTKTSVEESGLHPVPLDAFDRLLTERYGAGAEAPSPMSFRNPFEEFSARAQRPKRLEPALYAQVRADFIKFPFFVSSEDRSSLTFSIEALQDFLAGRRVAQRLNAALHTAQIPEGALGWTDCYRDAGSVFVRTLLYYLRQMSTTEEQLRRFQDVYQEWRSRTTDPNAKIPTDEDQRAAGYLRTHIHARL